MALVCAVVWYIGQVIGQQPLLLQNTASQTVPYRTPLMSKNVEQLYFMKVQPESQSIKKDYPFGQSQIHLRIENIVMSIFQHFVFPIYEYIMKGNEFRFNMGNLIGVNESVKGKNQIVKGVFFGFSP